MEKIILKNVSLIVEKEIVDPKLLFEEDLGFDSIAYINLISNLSDELDINILEFDEDELRVKSIQDLIDLMNSKVPAK